jgi:tetratricopeptide (TPR) repeat protein
MSPAGPADASPPAADDPTRTAIGAARMLAPGVLLAGRYRIDEMVGIGAMGMVYRARDEQLGVEVAIKVLRAERALDQGLLERFRQELILARQVSHRNVVRIHDIGQDGELWFLTMDFVAGRSLRQALEEDGPLDVAAALELARQLAAGLEAAHREGVVHRDLKPGNVLLGEGGRAFVTDFGIARSLAATGLTATGLVVGTPDYLAPEQARGEDVDHRTDLYALGLILFEALTGELPFRAGTLPEMLAQRVSGRPRRAAELGVELPPEVERVIARCLARDPADRYRDAAELLADLDAVAAGGRPRRRPRALLRRLVPPAAVFAAVAAVAAAVAAVWLRAAPAAEEPAAAPAAPRHSVAVLPLADETGRGDLGWVSTGVAERVAESLAESPDLRVVDGERVFRTLADLKLAPGPLDEPELRLLAELLDADRLVVGTVRAVGGRVRVDARLIAAAEPGAPAESVVAEAAGPDEVYGLADRLAEELRRRLGAAEPSVSAVAPPAAVAFEEWSRGVAALRDGEPGAAAERFEAAAAASPGWAVSWVRLAEAAERAGDRDRAVEAVRRAEAALGPEGGRPGYQVRARAADLTGEPARSREILAELVAAYPHDHRARLALAESLGAAGDFAAAAELLEEITRGDPNHPRAWLLLGHFAIFTGDARRARDEYLVRSLAIHNRLGDRAGQADTLNALGAAAQELLAPEEAIGYYRRAAAVSREIGDRRRYARALSNLSYVETLGGDHEAALASGREALAAFEALGDRSGAAGLHDQLGWIEEQRGGYREALGHYRRALAAFEELGDHHGQAVGHNSVGFALLLLGEYERAGEHFAGALDLYREAGDRAGEVFALQNRGQLELVRGEWSAALRSFLDALEGSRELEQPQAEAVSLANIGRVAQLQGRYAAALDSYREALDLLAALGDPRGLAEYTLFEAGALIELGLPAAAGERLERVRGWLAEGGQHEQRAELARLEAELALARDDPAAARRALAAAGAAAAESGSPAAALAVELTRGRAELAGGDPAAAAERLSEVAAAAARLGHAPLGLEASAALAEAELAAGRPGAAAAAAGHTLSAARERGPWAGAYRLHLVRAEALRVQGEPAAAAEELAHAREQVERLRHDLEAEARAAFDRLPAVERIGRFEPAAA